MIGTFVRGARHLWRLASSTPRTVIISEGGQPYDIGTVAKDILRGEERVFLFCHEFSTIRSHSLFDESGVFNGIINKGNFGSICEIYKDSGKSLRNINEILLLPETFDDDYESFKKENPKIIRELSNRYDLDINRIECKLLYCYANGSKNFFQWAMNLYLREGVRLDTIKNVMMWNDLYGQLTKKLSKNTITAYTTKKSISALILELTQLRKENRIEKSINSFNTTQKKLLKSHTLDDNDKHALSMFAKLSDVKRLNFIKKMSSVDSVDELMRQLKFLTSTHFTWDKKSFMDYIHNVRNIKYDIVYDNGNIVVVRVDDFETVKQLARSTNWCISKNKSYWNNYIEKQELESKQYVLFDFSKKEDDKMSIIGFTCTHNKGITHAHDFVNNSLMGDRRDTRLRFLNSFISNFINSANIYDVLKDDGVDVNIVATYDKPTYDWNKDSFFKYLYEYVDSFGVVVLSTNGDKIALSIRDSSIALVLGDAYEDNIPSEYWKKQHILFLDFSKSQYDPTKLTYAIINNGGYDEDSVIGVYDELCRGLDGESSFDEKLADFGLPYDIIRRADNRVARLSNALYNFNIPQAKKIAALDKSVLYSVNGKLSSDTIANLVVNSVTNYMSFDYLNLYYENGYTFGKCFGGHCPCVILRSFINTLVNRAYGLRNKPLIEIPSESLVKKFYAREINDRNEAEYVGMYLATMMLLDNDDFLQRWEDFNRSFSYMRANSFYGDGTDEIVSKMLSKIRGLKQTPVTMDFLNYLKASKLKKSYDFLSSVCGSNKGITIDSAVYAEAPF